MDNGLTRRGLLGRSVVGAVGVGVGVGLLGTPSAQAAASVQAGGRKRAIRVAHMTDMHIQPERAADQGVTECFHHVQNQKDKPEMILTGGDTIMDGFATDEARTKLQWELWGKVKEGECSLPVVSAMGNHDIFGWSKSKSKSTGAEKGWGKVWACEQFGRDKPYMSMDKAGWHFIVLDSVRMDKDDPDGYEAFLDDEQYAWLEKDLAGAAGKPTLIVSHVPILSATVFDGIKPNEKGDIELSGGLMHTDFWKLNLLFQKHKHVKACVSGHIHLVDRVMFNGVQHFCNGAVSGGWWKGEHKGCKPGYAMLDLYDDGTLENTYVPYGWEAKA